MFSKATDEWETPQAFFDALENEFCFGVDAAAVEGNKKCGMYLGPDQPFYFLRDALSVDWSLGTAGLCPIWLNPPYSQCREFIGKAAQEARKGCTVVCLVPARTDTRWFHEHVYDAEANAFLPGVEVRFLKGRLKFGASQNSAPFPSMVIIFRPVSA